MFNKVFILLNVFLYFIKSMKFNYIVEKTLLEEQIKDVLNEYLSISRNVLNGTNELITSIIEKMGQNKWNENNKKKPFIYLRFGRVLNDECFANIVTISVLIINFMVRENYIKAYNALGGNFNQVTRNLSLRLPFFDNKLYLPYAKPVIAHELEHAYQAHYANLTDKKQIVSKAYEMMEELDEDSNEYWLCYCVYFLSKPEINAKCHEFIYDLGTYKPKDKTELSKCPTYHEKNVIANKVKELDLLDKTKISVVLNRFKITKEKLFKHLYKQIDYINSSFLKVYQKYVNGESLLENNILEVPFPGKQLIR